MYCKGNDTVIKLNKYSLGRFLKCQVKLNGSIMRTKHDSVIIPSNDTVRNGKLKLLNHKSGGYLNSDPLI